VTATGLKFRVEKALRAVDEVMSDTSVGKEETLEAMHEIAERVDGNIEALEDDIG
jgi:hypothetical protein